MKIKASYGEQGNDNIPGYLYTDNYTIGPAYGNVSVLPTSTKGNRDISWEKGGNFNAGVEFSLFRGRLSGSVEYFYRKTSDMLAFFTLPGSYGYSGYYDNIGDMANHGVEVELDGTIFRTKDFTWGINLNFTAYKNKITSMPAENKTLTVDGVDGYSSGNYFYGEGEPMYTWYLTKYAGIDHETGEPMFYKRVTEPVLDADGNPTYDKDGNPITRTVNEKTTNSSEASQYLCHLQGLRLLYRLHLPVGRQSVRFFLCKPHEHVKRRQLNPRRPAQRMDTREQGQQHTAPRLRRHELQRSLRPLA